MSLTVSAGEQTKYRVPGIDLLRGLCIVAVVVHHINLRIHFRDSSLGQLFVPPFTSTTLQKVAPIFVLRVIFYSSNLPCDVGFHGAEPFSELDRLVEEHHDGQRFCTLEHKLRGEHL